MTTEDDVFPAPPDGFAFEPVHPGEVLQEELAARGLTANALAPKAARPRQPPDGNPQRQARRLARHGAPPQPLPRTQRRVLAEPAEPVRSGAGGEAARGEDSRGGGIGGVVTINIILMKFAAAALGVQAECGGRPPTRIPRRAERHGGEANRPSKSSSVLPRVAFSMPSIASRMARRAGRTSCAIKKRAGPKPRSGPAATGPNCREWSGRPGRRAGVPKAV